MGMNDFEEKANATLIRLACKGWRVRWLPDSSSARARVFLEKQTIEIYDSDEEAAWSTLIHEVVELRLRPVIRPYKEMCNALIGTIEKLTYARKEQFIDDILKMLKIF